MAQTGIEIKADDFVRRLVKGQRPQLDKPVALALVDTAKTARTRAASLIGRHSGLRVGRVREAISYDYVKVGDYQVVIRSSRKPIPLIEFPGTRQNAAGTRTRAWGPTQTLAGAFIATTTRGGRQVFRRKTSRRLPIKKLWGPTIHGTFAHAEVQAAIATSIRDRLGSALLRRIGSAMRGR